MASRSVDDLTARIVALDIELFEGLPAQTGPWDRRALLALHSAAATVASEFTYLEIGSYLGGSLQVAMRDPRCVTVLSIDPRPAAPPDKRGGCWEYPDNSLERMRSLLASLPGADLSKLVTFEQGTDSLKPVELGVSPDWCFIDGEHTDEAALRDARFCREAIGGQGVIAFHDYPIVKPGIVRFLREAWVEVTTVVGFGGTVFAVEFGDRGLLSQPLIASAVGSRWHHAVWRAGGARSSPRLLLAAWATMPTLDWTALKVRTLVRRRRGVSR